MLPHINLHIMFNVSENTHKISTLEKKWGQVKTKLCIEKSHSEAQPSLGKPGIWATSDCGVLWREWSPETRRSGDPAVIVPSLWALWVPKAVVTWMLPSCGCYSCMAGPELLVTSAPEFLWSLCICCHYGHEVDLALQVTRASWTPKNPAHRVYSPCHVALST